MARTVNPSRKPVRSLRRASYASRDSGSRRGPLAEWRGRQVHTEAAAVNERQLSQRRAADLAANDWVAESLISTLQHNVIGKGLVPNAQIPTEMLGLTDAQALELGRRFEWAFYRWSIRPDISGRSSFGEMQFLALRTMIALGELVHLPVMVSEGERLARNLPYALMVQAVSPARLRTPAKFSGSPDVHDGIRFDDFGRPLEYYLAAPASNGTGSMVQDWEDTLEFSTVPARIGHRPGILHLFVRRDDEQIRGESIFSNSANLFRYIDDAISYELEAQNMAAKFAIFMTREDPYAPMDGVTVGRDAETGEERYYSDIDGAGILYANPGEKPEMIKNERPSSNWENLIKLALSGVGGSASLSYLAVAKDYSNVNYSSARAAQNGDWKVYMWFRDFMANHYCQPFYDMVIEESYLRGEWKEPAGSPDFYAARDLWCSCAWTGPARGYMDPTKEIEADIRAVESCLATRHEIMTANGRDFDEAYPILVDEHRKMATLAALNTTSTPGSGGETADVNGASGSGSPAPAEKDDDDDQ